MRKCGDLNFPCFLPLFGRLNSFLTNGVILVGVLTHPSAGEDLSLKIDERDQTLWICILEL